MDRDTIIRLAREAGLCAHMDWKNPEFLSCRPGELERFAALVAAHEREACAKVCEELQMRNDCYDGTGNYVAGWSDGTDDCAAAIRSRT